MKRNSKNSKNSKKKSVDFHLPFISLYKSYTFKPWLWGTFHYIFAIIDADFDIECDGSNDSKAATIQLAMHRILIPDPKSQAILFNQGAFGTCELGLSRSIPNWKSRHWNFKSSQGNRVGIGSGSTLKTKILPRFNGLSEMNRMLLFVDLETTGALDSWWESDIVKNEKEEYILMDVECFFLTFAINALKVTSQHKDGQLLDSKKLWKIFRKQSLFDSIDPNLTPIKNNTNDFAIQYGVYHHFRTLGYTPKSGVSVGFDLVLYSNGGPEARHADFCVWIVNWDDKINVTEMAGRVRVANNVKKKMVICFVKAPCDSSIGTLGIQNDPKKWLSRCLIRSLTFSRWNPDNELKRDSKS